jgi:hypothetical protein
LTQFTAHHYTESPVKHFTEVVACVGIWWLLKFTLLIYLLSRAGKLAFTRNPVLDIDGGFLEAIVMR